MTHLQTDKKSIWMDGVKELNNMEKKEILVLGSVVIDIANKKEYFGGTAGNISYGLGLLGEKPLLFSLVGKDFFIQYAPHLENLGVKIKVSSDPKNKTASFSYSTTLKGSINEIWNPGAYSNISKLSLSKTIGAEYVKNTGWAIFAPGNQQSTLKHLKEFKKINKKAVTIFDPGQMIKTYTRKKFVECFNLADILILNEVEYEDIKIILGQDPQKLLNRKSKKIIKTLGGDGSVIIGKNETTKISAVRPKKVLDTMGAGDAYRAGLLYGLSKGFSLKKACSIGAKIAARNVAHVGCQTYKI